MSKKTAWDLLFDDIFDETYKFDCANHCPLYDCNKSCINSNAILSPKDKEYCREHLKQYFQQKADIQDGWGLVKEIYELLDKAVKDGEPIMKTYWRNYLKMKLEKAGIEVDDVN